MKKRMIATLCAIAIVLCAAGAVLMVPVNASGNAFQVGFSRVDINPWVDINDHSKGLRPLPLQGNSNPLARQSASTLIDDNGDGVIGEGDGLFATCLAISDAQGDMVLIYSVAIIGGMQRMISDTRTAVVAALAQQGIDIPAENIQIQGTHTHSSVDLTKYNASYENNTNTFRIQDQNGALTANTMTYDEVYDNFSYWYPYLINQLTAAGVNAVNDRAAATMSKGQIDAGDASGKVVNAVRHYTRQTYDGDTYISGPSFNKSGIPGNESDYAGAWANDYMYCLKFTFADTSKTPIALVNWRAHATQNDRNGTILNVSSDYVNRISYALSQGGYRSIFIQGAAGNINPTSLVYGSWCNSSKHVDANGDGLWIGNELTGNIYGEVVGAVAVNCLTNRMSSVSYGDVKVTNMVFYADAKSYDEEVMYYAALTAKAYYSMSGSNIYAPFVYPACVQNTLGGQTIYSRLSAELQAKANQFLASGESYAIASSFHAQAVQDYYQRTGKQKVELTAFMLGNGVAFVTAPGELFDRYNSQLTWEALAGKTKPEIYSIMSAVNEWDKLLSANVGGSYGTPFVMGYANGNIGYIPNNIAYEYNKNSTFAAVGSYEAHATQLAQGEGDHLMDIYASMLGSMVAQTDRTLHKFADCDACGERVMWKALSNSYNNMNQLPAGHYYLVGDAESGEKQIVGDTLCVDLNGYALLGQARAFSVSQGQTLNIMDHSVAADGYLAGYGDEDVTTGNIYFGGTLYVADGATVNLYSGGITQRFAQNTGAARGGCVLVSTGGVFNMYGGSIYGGKANYTTTNSWGGNVYLDGGTFNMHGGSISGGTASTAAGYNACGGNVALCATSTGNAVFNMYGGSISGGTAQVANATTGTGLGGGVYVHNYCTFNLYGGSISGGVAQSAGNGIYAAANGNIALSGNGTANEIYYTNVRRLRVKDDYTGSANLRLEGVSITAGTQVGVSSNAMIRSNGLTIVGTDLFAQVSGNNLVAGTYQICDSCGQSCIVVPLSQGGWDLFQGALPNGHYKLTGNITANMNPEFAGAGAALTGSRCLDLNGKTLTCNDGRLFKLLSGATLNISDSATGGKIITAGLPSEFADSRYGGMFYVSTGATLNLHSGTLTMAQGGGAYTQRGGIAYVMGTMNITGGTVSNGTCAGTAGSCHGGNIALGGTLNMSGGSITGGVSNNGTSNSYGGNVHILGGATLNLSGGSITGGTAYSAANGNCIRQTSTGKLVLSGTGVITQSSLYIGDVTVSGAYTGTAQLQFYNNTNPAAGTVIGVSNNANLAGATITVTGSDLVVAVSGAQLVLTD